MRLLLAAEGKIAGIQRDRHLGEGEEAFTEARQRSSAVSRLPGTGTVNGMTAREDLDA
jgi:hypothetical protein